MALPQAMQCEAAAWHSPQAMQPNGPPGIPPADGRPAFLGNTTVEVIRDVAAAAAKQVAAVLLHNPLITYLAEAAVDFLKTSNRGCVALAQRWSLAPEAN
jgi:hypothetical protein